MDKTDRSSKAALHYSGLFYFLLVLHCSSFFFSFSGNPNDLISSSEASHFLNVYFRHIICYNVTLKYDFMKFLIHHRKISHRHTHTCRSFRLRQNNDAQRTTHTKSELKYIIKRIYKSHRRVMKNQVTDRSRLYARFYSCAVPGVFVTSMKPYTFLKSHTHQCIASSPKKM